MALAVACSSEPNEPTVPGAEVSAAARELGIERFQIAETEAQLTIDGVNADDMIVASVELKVGRFVMQEDDRGEVLGRQMSVTVGDDTAQHESSGLDGLTLPAASLPRQIRGFVLDPQVSSRLAARGIGFDSSQPAIELADAGDTEVAYGMNCPYGRDQVAYGYSCTGGPWGAGCPAASGISFYKGGGEYGEFRCCSSPSTANERACTAPFSGSSCGGTGQGGCAVCWSFPRGAGCTMRGGPGWCGIEWCWPW